MTSTTFRLENFRAHQHIDWSPSGVCVLSGANGAGKSTTLAALQFIGLMFNLGVDSAFRFIGAQQLRRFDAAAEEPVIIEIEVGSLRWRLTLVEDDNRVLRRLMGEELYRDGERVMLARPLEQEWTHAGTTLQRDEIRCCLKFLWDRGEVEWLRPIVEVLDRIRIYHSYWQNKLQRPDRLGESDSFLHHTGGNLWSVLANWKSAPIRFRGQFDWVVQQARAAFPDLLGSLEFDHGNPTLYSPGTTDISQGMPPARAADGLLVGLAHLTAVAGAKDGSLLAFDEIENQLHPHAIRSIIKAMRRQCEERDLTIILTTHSPVVLNQFRDEPEQVYVLGPHTVVSSNPASMAELHDEDWLAQAKLGALYENLAFGAPHGLGAD